MNDILLNKKCSIERCIAQINDYYARQTGLLFEQDYLRQDAIAMNLQRACEMTIDCANHVIKLKKLGLPRDSRDSFLLLHQAGIIDQAIMESMQAMVTFRNILVHEYKRLEFSIIVEIIEHRLQDILNFTTLLTQYVERK